MLYEYGETVVFTSGRPMPCMLQPFIFLFPPRTSTINYLIFLNKLIFLFSICIILGNQIIY